MVLSNKKLKQKIREALAPSEPTNEGGTPVLQALIDVARKKSRLAKIKKRKTLKKYDEERNPNENEPDNAQEEEQGNNSNTKKKMKRDSQNQGKEVTDDKHGKQNKSKKTKKSDNGENEAENTVSQLNQATKNKKKKKDSKQKNMAKIKNHNRAAGNKPESSAGEDSAINASSKDAAVSVGENVAGKDDGYDARKLYVGGIPYYSTEDDIRSFFESCGTITEIDCMTFPDSGKFRGIALVTFKTEAAANRALALDGTDMGGLFLKIQKFRSLKDSVNQKPSKFEPSRRGTHNRAYLGNLDWNITEDDLQSLFKDCEVSNIRFGTDKNTGEFKCYAHVDFADEVSLAMAIKLDQTIVCGRPIRISYAIPKDAKSESAVAAGSTSKKKKKRQTCYKCGKPGHISSSCPASESNEVDRKEDA